MKTMTTFMATTAICTFIAGTAAAQGLEADVGADVGVSAETNQPTGTEGTTGLNIDSTTGADVGAETPAAPTMTATPDADTQEAITTTAEAIAGGEVVMVLSADGQTLGHVETATQDDRGAAEFSIVLDSNLGASAERVTYSGTAEVDAAGNVIVPLAEADFVSRIMAPAGTPPG